MIRAIGAALVVACCGGIGFRVAASYRRRTQEIRVLTQAIRLLQGEIEYRLSPLPQALLQVSKRTASPLDVLFGTAGRLLDDGETSVAEAFHRGVQAAGPNTALLPADVDVVLEFGKTLGTSDRLHQSQQIEVALARLSAQETEARETQRRNERLWQYLGVLCGLLIVILLY